MSVAYLGPDGSFSSTAAKTLFNGPEMFIPCQSFADTMEKVQSGEATCAVLPFFNSVNGSVTQNMDLLNGSGCFAFKKITLGIEHRLYTKRGVRLKDIKRVYSHSQALEQCGQFLKKHIPQAELIAVQSTSESIEHIQSETDAAIASPLCSSKNLVMSRENIADEPTNSTTFLVLKKGQADYTTHSNFVYFCVTCAHKPGALVKILEEISGCSINMTRIESRPIKNKVGEFSFYIEIEGDISSERIAKTLDRISAHAYSMSVLGAY